MKAYVERVSDRLREFCRGNAQMDQSKNKNEKFSHSRARATNDLFTDFQNLFQLQGIQTICESHSELLKAYKSKIEEMKKVVQTMADERRAVLKREQQEFMEAKRKGVRALINYKLSKQKYRQKLTNVEKQFANDFKRYTSLIEEEVAFNKLKQMEETRRNVGYMYVRNDATKETKIIGAGINLEYSKEQINKLTKLQNILNIMSTKLNPKDHGKMLDLLDNYTELAKKIDKNWDLADIIKLQEPNLPLQQKQQQIGFQQSVIRMQMKHWKFQKGYNANSLYSS
jgi:hypothetical protein